MQSNRHTWSSNGEEKTDQVALRAILKMTFLLERTVEREKKCVDDRATKSHNKGSGFFWNLEEHQSKLHFVLGLFS